MRRWGVRFGVLALILFTCASGWAADTLSVAVGDLRGRGLNDRQIGKFQKQLKRVEGVRIQSTRGFRSAAKRAGLRARGLDQDQAGIATVCNAAGVDAVIYGILRRGQRRRDRVIRLSVFDGRTGQLVGEHDVKVARGRSTRRVWEEAARAVAPDLYRILDGQVAPPAPVEPPPDLSFSAPVPVAPPPPPRASHRRTRPVLRLHGGLALTGRTFEYEADPTSPRLAEGISYESSVVPGVALDLEAYPGEAFTGGFAAGFGLGLRFEKVFLSTEQVDPTTNEVKELETNHSHLLFRLLYRRALTRSAAAVELIGHVGYGLLNFEVEENEDYRGATWSYVDLGLGVHAPLVGQTFALDADLSLLPGADLGDRTEELGEDVSSTGWRIYAGASSRLAGGLSFMGGLEYTRFGSEVSGEGRDGRIGKAATDSYLTVRLMAGYQY